MIMIKRIVFLIALMLLPVLAGAQKVIQMEKEGGVYKIACKVNGARMKMIFDTGASSVSLSMSIANYLYDNDYITKEDILGKGKSQTADGSIVDHIVINLRDIEIDGLHLKNVEATVIAGQDAPLLLGQSAIQKLGSVTISGNSLVINNAPSHAMSDEEVEQLRHKAAEYWHEDSYFAAIELYSVLRKNSYLNGKDYYRYMLCCCCVSQYERAIELFKEWENESDYSNDEEDSSYLIYSLAEGAYCELKDYKSMIYCLEKKIAIIQMEGRKPNAKDCQSYAVAYDIAGMYDMAIKYYIEAIRGYLSLNKNTIADIYNGKIAEGYIKEGIGSCLAYYGILYNKLNDYQPNIEGIYLAIGAAKCGNKTAIEFFRDNDINIDYKKYGYSSQFDYLFIAR